jgi:hypothetical protein
MSQIILHQANQKNELANIQTTLIDIVKSCANSKLIKDSSDSELADRLLKIYYLIGLRPKFFPTREMDAFLFNYIRENYGHRNIDELYLAFDLAVKRRFEVKEINPYDQFSIPYLVDIMDSYRLFLKDLHNSKEKNKLQDELPKFVSDEEKKSDIEYWQNKQIDFYLVPIYLYDYMVNLKLIKEDDCLKYLEAAIKIRQNDLLRNPDKANRQDARELQKMYDEGYLYGSQKNIIINIAKKITIKKYYESKSNI